MLIVDVLEHLSISDAKRALNEVIRIMRRNSYIFLHIPLEGSCAYKIFRVLRRIWSKDPDHKHDYTYDEFLKLLSEFPLEIEKGWIDKRMGIIANSNICAVAVTYILKEKSNGKTVRIVHHNCNHKQHGLFF